MIDPDRVSAELVRACEDAGLEPAAFVVFVVDAPWPLGTTPMAYLQPAGHVWPDTVVVFRAVGAVRAGRHHLAAHRLAVWNDLPGVPAAALGPMLRHELEHARRWELSGSRFFEADDFLRAALRRAGGHGYATLPTELEANAASAAFAARTLAAAELDAVRSSPECEALLSGHEAPADVVEATLAQLAGRDDWGTGMTGAERAAYVDGVRAACAAWEAPEDGMLTAGRTGPAIERVPLGG